MLDSIVKALALIAVLASLSVLAWKVDSLDLITVIAIVMAAAIYDFFVRPYFMARRQQR